MASIFHSTRSVKSSSGTVSLFEMFEAKTRCEFTLQFVECSASEAHFGLLHRTDWSHQRCDVPVDWQPSSSRHVPADINTNERRRWRVISTGSQRACC